MSKRLRGLLAAILGLVALVALGLALVAVLGPQGRLPVVQATYPLGTSPPASKASSTPKATATPGPYPPIYPTMTPWPYPRIYHTMTPWPTATPRPTPEPPPPPQPIGLQIVWAEAEVGDGPGYIDSIGPATFYVADVGDLARRKTLYAFSQDRLEGRLASASLAPDGHAIAFTTYSRGSHPYSSGVLWVMRLDESRPQELVRGMNGPGRWCWPQDGHLLAYTRYAPRQSPLPDKESSPDRLELHIISVDSKEDKALIAEDDVDASPLGWTVDGRLLYLYSGAQPDIKRGLWSVDVASGERTFITALPRGEVPKLAPDGRRLLFWTTEGLVSLSSDGRERKNVDFPGVVMTSADTKITADVSWAANSSEVIYQTGPDNWRIGNLDTGDVRDITVAWPPPNLRERLISVSPDGQWLAVLRGGLTLLKVNERFEVTVVNPGTFDLFVGWLPRNANGGTQ